MRARIWLALSVIFACLSGTFAADIGVTMSMPNSLNANPGRIVTVPIDLRSIQGPISLDAFQLIVEYDDAFFETPVAPGIKLGTLTTGRDYTGLDNVTTASKSFSILRSATSDPTLLTTNSGGSIMTFEMRLKASMTIGNTGFLKFWRRRGPVKPNC